MAYTKSNDGQMRTNVNVQIRCTKNEMKTYQAAAVAGGFRTVRLWLADCLRTGIVVSMDQLSGGNGNDQEYTCNYES